jgi:hypothetical protein
MDELINFEYVEDDEEVEGIEGIPIIGIAQLPDGTFSFQTTLPGPRELLWVLEQVKKEVLEDYLG